MFFLLLQVKKKCNLFLLLLFQFIEGVQIILDLFNFIINYLKTQFFKTLLLQFRWMLDSGWLHIHEYLIL